MDPTKIFDISGRTALVTGASSGLGAEFARALGGAGANVVITGRRADRLTALAGEVGGDVLAVPADVTDPADRVRVVDAALERWGRIDILVNNAGTLLADHPDARDETVDDFSAVLAVNLVALFAMSQLVARAMGDGGGSIVNIGSMFGDVAATGGASYVSSKGAVHALTRELAVQWASAGIRVNALAPGYFRSELTEHVFDTPAGQRMLGRTVPLGRGGSPEELAGALLYFCSDASSYCTGQVLVVDGGYTAR